MCNDYLEEGGGGEMGEICPKTKSYPPLIKKKYISTPLHIMIILRLTITIITISHLANLSKFDTKILQTSGNDGEYRICIPTCYPRANPIANAVFTIFASSLPLVCYVFVPNLLKFGKCKFGANPFFRPVLEGAGLSATGRDAQHQITAICFFSFQM